MLVVGFPTGSFAANCYLVASAAGQPCVIIDPGEAAVPGVEAALAEHRLRPAAVLLTHGHLDHMLSVLPVCEANDVPAYVHPADRAQLSDPLASLPTEWAAALGLAGVTFREPDDVRELADGVSIDVAGLSFGVEHAPGHSAGSVVFRTADGGPDGEPLMFAGDLVFAGSIGRTDLPGGDDEAMRASLARVVLGSADETVVLPGHGPRTTIGRERATNPYLLAAAGAAGAGAAGAAGAPGVAR